MNPFDGRFGGFSRPPLSNGALSLNFDQDAVPQDDPDGEFYSGPLLRSFEGLVEAEEEPLSEKEQRALDEKNLEIEREKEEDERLGREIERLLGIQKKLDEPTPKEGQEKPAPASPLGPDSFGTDDPATTADIYKAVEELEVTNRLVPSPPDGDGSYRLDSISGELVWILIE